MFYLTTELLNQMRSVLLAAQTEGNASSQSKHGDDTGNQGIQDSDIQPELGKRGCQTENDYGVPGNSSQEIGSMKPGAHNRGFDYLLHEVSHYNRNEHNENSHQHLRDVE